MAGYALLLGTLLTASSVLAQTTTVSTVEKKIDDVYNLEEWENNTAWFGQVVLGGLNSYPDERNTVQRLLYILKERKQRNNTSSTELTTLLLRGMFAESPDYLNSTSGQGTLSDVSGDVEKELESLTIDNFYNCKKRNETCFYDPIMTDADQSHWLMEHVDWQRLIALATLSTYPGEKETVLRLIELNNKRSNGSSMDLTIKLMRGAFAASPDYLNSTDGKDAVSGFSTDIENDLKELTMTCKVNQTCFNETTSQVEQSEWLFENADWPRIAAMTSLSSYPAEKDTTLRLLELNKQQQSSRPSLDLTTLLARGVFAASPDYLNSTGGKSAVSGVGTDIENDLKRLTMDCKENQTCFNESMAQADKSKWLLKNADWPRIAAMTTLNSYPVEKITVLKLLELNKQQQGNRPSLDLTTLLMRGYFAASPMYLNSSDGQSTVFGAGLAIEKELSDKIVENNKTCVEKQVACYHNLNTQIDKSKWLMANVDWRRIILISIIGQPYEKYKPVDVNQQCYTDAVHMLRSFFKGETWAIEMFDAMGKPQIGVFQGNLNWVGQYDQCNLITADRSGEDAYKGSYCDIKMKLPEYIKVPSVPGSTIYLRMGLCFPSTCGAADVKSIMENLKLFGAQFPEIEYARCHSDSPGATGEFATDGLAHFASVFMGFFAGLVLLCTIIEGFLWYESDDESTKKASTKPVLIEAKGMDNKGYDVELTEISLEEKGNGHTNGTAYAANSEKSNGVEADTSAQVAKGKPRPESIGRLLIRTFSLYTNVPALLSTAQPKGALKSLDALRVFNMNWIVLGHVHSIGAVFMQETMANAKLAADKIKDWTFMGVYTGMLAVDSYFFISGLLVSYLFLKASAKNKGRWGFQLAVYFIHRLWRILPLYGILILVYAAFGKYLGSGPLFDWQSDRVRDCNNNWWANLLFINNFYKPKEMCLGWSWYLSNDMQFYVLAPTMLIPLFLKPFVGLCIILIYFGVHWTATAVLWERTGGKSYLQDSEIFYEAYITPYCRIGPYLVGILLGWIFYKDYKIKNKFVVVGCWLLTILTMGLVVYSQYDDVKDFGVLKNGWNTAQRTIFETFSRDAWGLCMAWIVYACNNGYAGFVGHILNWKGWTPLGRMTFAVYLVHPIVIFIYAGNRRDLNYVDDFSVSFLYSGYVILSYLGGAVLSMIFEAPPAGLDKLIMSRLKPKAS